MSCRKWCQVADFICVVLLKYLEGCLNLFVYECSLACHSRWSLREANSTTVYTVCEQPAVSIVVTHI